MVIAHLEGTRTPIHVAASGRGCAGMVNCQPTHAGGAGGRVALLGDEAPPRCRVGISHLLMHCERRAVFPALKTSPMAV